MEKAYYQRTARLLGEDAVLDLAKKTVMVFGVGGVGSFVVEALARTNIGHLILIDADTFEESNINRQLGATMETMGRYKVDVMKERIASLNPDCVVDVHPFFYLPEQQPDFIANSGADYIVDAIDTMTAKINVIEEATKAGIPVISSMGAGNKLHPELFQVAYIEDTSVDPMAKIMRKELKKRGIKKVKVVYSQEQPRPIRGCEGENRPSPGSIAFVPSAAGLIMAGVVVRDLLHID